MTNSMYYPIFADNKWGLADRNGNQVVPIVYNYNNSSMFFIYNEDYMIVEKNDKYGVLNIKSCIETISTNYADIYHHKGNQWIVKNDRTWYLWEDELFYEIGNYEAVTALNDEYLIVQNKHKAELNSYDSNSLDHVYSITQKRIVQKPEIRRFSDDLALVCVDSKYGFINRSFDRVIPAIYDYAEDFENGYAYTEVGSQNYYINTQGQQLVSDVFKNSNYENDEYGGLDCLMEGVHKQLACYKEHNLIGLKSVENHIITLPIYDFIYLAYEEQGYIIVTQNGKDGMIDTQGSIIVPCEYDTLTLSSGTKKLIEIGVINDGSMKYGIIDITNNCILSPLYHSLNIINNETAIIGTSDELYGILNIHTQEYIIPPIYDKCFPFEDLYFVVKDDTWKYFNVQGEEVMRGKSTQL